MNCKNCGIELEEGVAFCSNCGAQVPAQQPAYDSYEEASPAPQAYTSPAPAPEAPRPAYKPAAKQPAGQPSKGLGIVGMILGISSFVLGLCSFLFYIIPFTLSTGIVGLILSSKAANSAKAYGVTDSRAKLGRTFSIIGIALVGLLVLAVIAVYVIYFVFGISFLSGAVGFLGAMADSSYYY